MSKAAFELQKAIYSHLTASMSGVEILDYAKEVATKPFIVVGDDEVSEWGTSDDDGEEIRVKISAFSSDYRGKRVVKELLAQVYDILHHTTALAVVGFDVVLIHFTDSDVTLLNDGKTHQGEARYRALLDKVS